MVKQVGIIYFTTVRITRCTKVRMHPRRGGTNIFQLVEKTTLNQFITIKITKIPIIARLHFRDLKYCPLGTPFKNKLESLAEVREGRKQKETQAAERKLPGFKKSRKLS